MAESSKFRDDEGTRPCPTCRMPVSVLAVKCRFCGCDVGRPKEATRSLTVDDLGGETVVQYAPSSNVMDAIESFRNEVSTEEEARRAAAPERSTIFGKRGKKTPTPAAKGASELPELDERSRALASIAMPRQSAAPSRPVQRYTPADFVRYGAIAVGAIVVLYLAAFQAPGWISAMNAPPTNDFVSRYPILKERGAPSIQLLEAAIEGMARNPNSVHVEHLEEARSLVKADVEGLLAARDWNRNKLVEASDIAKQAADMDAGMMIQQLKVSVDAESQAYNTVLERLDSGTNEATFRIAVGNRGEERVTVKRGEVFADRFELSGIAGNQVRIVDKERNNRRLTARVGGRFE